MPAASHHSNLAQLAPHLQLEYEVLGRAHEDVLPVVLVRPMLGDMSLWGEFASDLAAERRVVCFNPRGVGRSRGPWLGLRIDDLARDVLLLADHLELPRFDLVGLSLGGMVAISVALAASGRIGHLVLVSTLLRGRDVPLAALLDLLPGPISPPETIADGEAQALGRLLSKPFWKRAPLRALEAMRRLRARPTPLHYLFALGLAAFARDPRKSIVGLDCPTLLIFGEKDRLVGPAARDDLARALPHAHKTILAGSGHDLSLECPRRLAQVVQHFLSLCSGNE